jgi:AraC-like DNA-binding protein
MLHYQEYSPCTALKPFIKTYYLFETVGGFDFEDFAYATGNIEMMFNIGDGTWKIDNNGSTFETPAIELWGQIINPLKFKSIGQNTMLGVRFYPHTAGLFLKDDVSQLNNNITNTFDLLGKPIAELHEKIREQPDLENKILLLDKYFLKVLSESKLDKMKLLDGALKRIKHKEGHLEVDALSKELNISARYLNKLFVQNIGVSPKLYHKINRFQQSLLLLDNSNHSLTSIAYQCGYFDQSHFIKDFKYFTGKLPSDFPIVDSTAILAAGQK